MFGRLAQMFRNLPEEISPPYKRRNIKEEESPVQMTADEIEDAMRSTDVDRQFVGMQAARKMLSREGDPPIDLMIGHGIVPIAIRFLQNYDNPLLQFEAAWFLTNIASGNSEQTRCVVDNDAVPHLVALLKSNNVNLADQALWALGNIAGDSTIACDIVFNHNVTQVILSWDAKNIPLSVSRNIYYLVNNLNRNASDSNTVDNAVEIYLKFLQKLPWGPGWP